MPTIKFFQDLTQEYLQAGDLETYQFFYRKDKKLLGHLIVCAMRLGHTNVLDWIWELPESKPFWNEFQQPHPFEVDLYFIAMDANQIAVLDWLWEHDIPGKDGVSVLASNMGSRPDVKAWCQQRSIPLIQYQEC